MERMKNAPIRYSLALIRFPRLFAMESTSEPSRTKSEARYPIVDEHINQGWRMEIGQTVPRASVR